MIWASLIPNFVRNKDANSTIFSHQWIGLREDCQEPLNISSEKPLFPVDFPLNQSSEQ